MISPDQIDAWRRAEAEHERLEFKEAKNQLDNETLYDYCVALANEGGGHLLLGISNKPPRTVVGTNAFRDPAGMAQKLFDVLKFRVDLYEVQHPDGRVLVFEVPGRPRGTAYDRDGRYLMRAGSALVPMSEDRLRKIFDEGKPDWLSEPARSGLADADVVQLLDTQSYFDLLKLPYPATRTAVIERFERERLLTVASNGLVISNLGALLFAKRLEEFDRLARKAPRVIVYEGRDKLRTRLDQPGSRGYAVGFERLVEFVMGQVPANEVVELALREQVKMFPPIAIRELVANALIHQDFTESGTSVVIELYADRLEVSSPGKPFIQPERFIDEYQSRNERLADLMRRFGICEEKGSGIDKVVNSAEVFQLPAPDFRVSDRRTTVVLFAHRPFERMDRNDRIRACYQHCCLRYVTNERMTNQSLRERFKLPEAKAASVSQVITATQEAGTIKPDDRGAVSKRYARYVPFWA